ATVQKLLDRLEKTDDGYVSRDRSATPHVFAAAITRDAYIGGQLRAMARRLCGGSLTPLLTHLIRTDALSARDPSAPRRLPGQAAGPHPRRVDVGTPEAGHSAGRRPAREAPPRRAGGEPARRGGEGPPAPAPSGRATAARRERGLADRHRRGAAAGGRTRPPG